MMMNENEGWLDRLQGPGRKPPRKCGHCHQVGHMVPNCPAAERLAEDLFEGGLAKIERDPLGYSLEQYVQFLTVPSLKLLYKRMCAKTLKKKEEGTYDEIFEAFRGLNLGYLGRRERRVRLYSGAFSAVEADVATNRHGHHLQAYLRHLNMDQVTELANRIVGNGGEGWMAAEHLNWVGSFTESRERQAYTESRPHHNLLWQQFYVHCHFSEMNLGYNFTVHQYVNVNLPMLAPITTLVNKQRTKIQVDRNVNGVRQYSKSMYIEKVAKEGGVEPIDCAVCIDPMESCQFVKFNCNHEFCGGCVGRVIGGAVKRSFAVLCPMCRSPVTKLTYAKDEVLVGMRETIVA